MPFWLAEGSHVIAVIAHPDDEFMFGEAIRSLVSKSYPLDVVVLTDGEASTRGEPEFVRSGKRQRESRQALGALGLCSDRQWYLRLPDTKIGERKHTERAALSLANLALAHGTSAIITTGPDGFGHDDHSAAHDCAVAAASIVYRVNNKSAPTVWGLSERPGEETFLVNSDAKLAVLRHHVSQFALKAAGLDAPPPPKGWVRLGGYDIAAEHYALLRPYEQLLEVESYNRHGPITSGRLYDILGK